MPEGARRNGRKHTKGATPARHTKRSKAKPQTEADAAQLRLNRYIARAGVCSRRKADELIAAGRVRVNGEVVTDFGTRVTDADQVEVSGRIISRQTHRYILLNKPTDVITTTSDEKGRATVLDLLALPENELQGLFPVGRLDRNTVGTLLVTNDGELAHRLMHPRFEVDKVYRVRTKEPVKPHELDVLSKGVQLEDGVVAAERAAYIDPENHYEVGILLHEGRNRQVRRMFEVLGHEVAQLERVSYAGLTTQGIRRGRWRELTPHEVRKLRRLVRLK